MRSQEILHYVVSKEVGDAAGITRPADERGIGVRPEEEGGGEGGRRGGRLVEMEAG